jgi:hypothetical protein
MEILGSVGIFLGICLVGFIFFALSINYVFDKGVQDATHKVFAFLGGLSVVGWAIFGIYKVIT